MAFREDDAYFRNASRDYGKRKKKLIAFPFACSFVLHMEHFTALAGEIAVVNLLLRSNAIFNLAWLKYIRLRLSSLIV